eukprot:scaffold23325_cov35-Prasinocladus_malaysianus.AAC.1
MAWDGMGCHGMEGKDRKGKGIKQKNCNPVKGHVYVVPGPIRPDDGAVFAVQHVEVKKSGINGTNS